MRIFASFLLALFLSTEVFAQTTPPGSQGNLITNGGGYEFGALAVGNTLTSGSTLVPNTINVTQKLPRLSNLSTDTIQSTDYALAVDYTGTGTTVTVPIPSSSTFFTGFSVTPSNLGTGLVTLTISGASFVTPYGNVASLPIPAGMACYIYSDGSNWQVPPETCPAVNLVLHGYTVATLPTGTKGFMSYVTDASTCTLNGSLTGGGSTFCPVIYNGSAWVGL